MNQIEKIEKIVNDNFRDNVHLHFASPSEFGHQFYCPRNTEPNQYDDWGFDDENIITIDDEIEDVYELQFIDDHDSYYSWVFVDKDYNVKSICYGRD